jgi:hypothetical protein
MAITTRDQLIDAMGNNSSRIVIDKPSVSGQAAGNFVSMWRATGQPGQGAIPTTAAVCNNTTTGAIGFTQQTAPAKSYLGILESVNSLTGQTTEIHDRLMHMGGLSGVVTTAQTVNLDVSANLGTLADRIGDANYSDIQWWMEWYTATGASVVNATVNVTFGDATSNNLALFSLPATRPASLMIPLNSLIQSADAGKYIADINSVTLSVTTGTAGNFGFTATRYRAGQFVNIANGRVKDDWAQLGLPEIVNGSCLFPVVLSNTTSSGNLRATGKIIHG